MIAALILVVSLVGLGQFALFYLRAILVSVAAQPLTGRVQALSGLAGGPVRGEDFAKLLMLHEICPELKPEKSRLKPVQLYYSLIQAMSRLGATHLTLFASWASAELDTCAQYAAVLLDRRMERNLAAASQLRSY